MSNLNMEGLPPEMQQRITSIIEGAKQNAKPAQPQPAPIQKPPSLLDHTVALRHEVAALRQELNAVAQVTDAVGQAVGQLYQTFLGESTPADYSSAYEAHQQMEPQVETDY